MYFSCHRSGSTAAKYAVLGPITYRPRRGVHIRAESGTFSESSGLVTSESYVVMATDLEKNICIFVQLVVDFS